jgi:hypothetical protein
MTHINDDLKNNKEYFMKESKIGIQRIITKEIIEAYVK